MEEYGLKEPGKQEETIVTFSIWNEEKNQVETYDLKKYVIEGGFPGPHVVINAGSHGDEFLAIETAKEVYEEIQPGQVHGTITVIPEANMFAALDGRRETPCPQFEIYESEERNLNRCFDRVDLEEGPQGNITERLAYHVLNEVTNGDYCLDLHTATDPGYKIDQIRGKTDPEFSKETLDGQERLIRNCGLRYVIKSPSGVIGRGVLAGTAPLYDVPTVTVEIGAGIYTEDELERYKEVVYSMLQELDVLPGDPEQQDQKIYRNMYDVCAQTAGMYNAVKEPGDEIVKGEVLGRITNEDGVHEIVTPYDGLVESVHRHEWVNEGTRVSFIAIQQERNFLEAISDAITRFLKFHTSRVRNDSRRRTTARKQQSRNESRSHTGSLMSRFRG